MIELFYVISREKIVNGGVRVSRDGEFGYGCVAEYAEKSGRMEAVDN